MVHHDNTDRELWRERAGDYFSDSVHVTESGGIGINVGGRVLVASARAWHDAGMKMFTVDEKWTRSYLWRRRLAMWLLGWGPTPPSPATRPGEVE